MIDVIETKSQEEMQKAFNIRRIVFCDEQKVDPQLEFDGLDLNAGITSRFKVGEQLARRG